MFCSEHMNDWQYLSLRTLEQNNYFSPTINLEVFLCLKISLWSRDKSRDPKFNMKEIGEFSLFGKTNCHF